MPIFEAIYNVIKGNITVKDAMDDLMTSPIGREIDYL
jgi:glycerol-3-phosphate dehydrogenase